MKLPIKKNCPIEKVCGCGRKYNLIPEKAKEWLAEEGVVIGFLWECECKSHLFFSVFKTDVKDCSRLHKMYFKS